MHRLASNLPGPFVLQEAFFPPFRELKLCLNDIISHQKAAVLSSLQTNDPTFPDSVSDWETESQPEINAAERSHQIWSGCSAVLNLLSFRLLTDGRVRKQSVTSL